MRGEDFLQWEAQQPDRHQLFEGEVFAMAGAEDRHVTTAGNVYIALRQHLSGTPCRTFMADMKVHVEAGDCFFYPDVLVTCNEADRGSPLVKREPILLVEVLSASTAAFDRGGKFAKYRSISSVQEVVFIDLDLRHCDVYRRANDGLWVLHPFGPAQALELASVDLTISAEAVFAEVDG
jgi:Uma2 family endonuclease